jgi:hypothetical protein
MFTYSSVGKSECVALKQSQWNAQGQQLIQSLPTADRELNVFTGLVKKKQLCYHWTFVFIFIHFTCVSPSL